MSVLSAALSVAAAWRAVAVGAVGECLVLVSMLTQPFGGAGGGAGQLVLVGVVVAVTPARETQPKNDCQSPTVVAVINGAELPEPNSAGATVTLSVLLTAAPCPSGDADAGTYRPCPRTRPWRSGRLTCGRGRAVKLPSVVKVMTPLWWGGG